jgi:hypothetical protein
MSLGLTLRARDEGMPWLREDSGAGVASDFSKRAVLGSVSVGEVEFRRERRRCLRKSWKAAAVDGVARILGTVPADRAVPDALALLLFLAMLNVRTRLIRECEE